MEERITREELLERLFHDDYENLKGRKLRLTRVRVPGRSIDFAHVISPSDAVVYQNLALNIGVHEGEDHTGQSIGIVRVTPWEAVVVATDVAVKAADVEVGFMDRFSGALIILGGLSQVMTAIEEVVKYLSSLRDRSPRPPPSPQACSRLLPFCTYFTLVKSETIRYN